MLEQVKGNRWEDENGSYIYRDEFGTYLVGLHINGKLADYEVAKSFKQATSALKALYERN